MLKLHRVQFLRRIVLLHNGNALLSVAPFHIHIAADRVVRLVIHLPVLFKTTLLLLLDLPLSLPLVRSALFLGDLLLGELTPCAHVLREEGLEIESLELLLQTLAGRAMRVVAVGDLDIIDEPDGGKKAQAEARAAVLLDLNVSDDVSDWDRERA